MTLSFEPTSAQLSVRDAARAFATETLAPRAVELEAAEAVPAEIFRQLGERGLMAVGVDPDALVERADRALYMAKARGKDRAVRYARGWGNAAPATQRLWWTGGKPHEGDEEE